MNLQKYNKLQKKFENQKFEIAQRWTSFILYYGSYLGHLLSIILSFFFIHKLAGDSAVHFAGQTYILPVFIILFLTIFELAKRFTFANVITTYLTTKKLTTSFFFGLFFVVLLVGGTFYLSLSGASTYVNKTDIITTSTDNIINTRVDSINFVFKGENNKLEERITYLYEAAKTRKNKSLKESEVLQVKNWEASIETNNKKLEDKVADIKRTYESKANSQKEQTGKSQLAFLLISGFIELLILIGIGFKCYYEYTSFKELQETLENNTNYQKLIAYQELLKVLFNNGKTGTNAALPSSNGFRLLVLASTRKYPLKTIKEFLTLMNHLKISQLIGKTRTTVVKYEKAQEILENYLTIDTQ